jgi:hypothetical protein
MRAFVLLSLAAFACAELTEKRAAELEAIREEFRGINFEDAARECDDTQWGILTTGTREAFELVNFQMRQEQLSPAWNRYFMDGSRNSDWHSVS